MAVIDHLNDDDLKTIADACNVWLRHEDRPRLNGPQQVAVQRLITLVAQQRKREQDATQGFTENDAEQVHRHLAEGN